MTTRKDHSLFLCIVMILLVAASSAIADTYSGTVLDSKTNKPVPGVRVSFGFTDTVTNTDSNGYFSFGNGSDVKRRHFVRNSESVLVKRTQRGALIDLNRCLSVNTVKMFNLNGRCLYRSDVPDHNRVLLFPGVSNGLYIIQFLAGNSAQYVMKWNSAGLLQSVNAISSIGKGQLSSSVSTGRKIVFLNDSYYPLVIDQGQSPQTVSMKADPRCVIFDEKKIGRYDFTLTSQDSLSMEKNAIDELYVPAQFSYNNVTFGKIGLRYKGSSYSLPNCFEDDGTRKIKPECEKISLKVKFDEYDDSLRFYKMKRLNLHSESIDPSKMHDILSYGLFREMGIMAPRCAYAKVFINGVFQGLFCAVEDIDGRFTDARWPEDGNGNLYKDKWPISNSSTYYKSGLVTNDKPEDSADVAKMVQFYKAINSSDESNFKDNVSSFLDFDYWLHCIAVDRVIHNSDGMMTWYVKPNWVSNHNYFFYQPDSADAKLWIIPWDLHVTLGRKDQIIDVLGVPDWNVKPETCDTIIIWGNQTGLPPNCDKLTGLTAAVFWDNFVKISEHMLSTCFNVKYLQNKVDTYKNLIDSVIQKDPHVDHATWLGQVNSLRGDIAALNSDFDDYIHKRSVVNDTSEYLKSFNGTGYLVTDQLNNFEFQPLGNEKLWSTAMISINSTSSVKQDTVNPLWGKSDVLYSFVFNPVPGTDMYQEWGKVALKFKSPVDLTKLKEIQVNLKSDSNRDLWLYIASSEYGKNYVYSEYGWWESTSGKDSLKVFKLNNIGYPSWAKGNPPDILQDVLTNASGIGFQSNPHFGPDGKLLTVPDSGYLRIDNIRFVF
jgi:spore coat protein H